MAGKGKLLLGFALAFLVGTVVGLAIGGYGGFHFGACFILDQCLSKDARNIQSHVVMLRHLRTGKMDQAIELLEVHLDDELIIFDPEKPYPRLSRQTTFEINKAIRESKEYRLAHPRKSNRPAVDQMVRNVFLREPYK
ncbi:MAG: hypothetical protein AB1393_03820 [Candidatus Edwardsbacteria bacterium]